MLKRLVRPWRRSYRPLVKGLARLRMKSMTIEQRFNWIYQRNLWRGARSASGRGSDLARTATIRTALPNLLRQHDVKVMLDIPCGDGFWIAHADLSGLEHYIVADLRDDNHLARARLARPRCTFLHLDLTRDPLPSADLILCRDCLVHLSHDDIWRALRNIARSGARYVLMTHFGGPRPNVDITAGDWRPLNLCRPPFHFPPPLAQVPEDQGAGYQDKVLALWQVERLPTAPGPS